MFGKYLGSCKNKYVYIIYINIFYRLDWCSIVYWVLSRPSALVPSSYHDDSQTKEGRGRWRGRSADSIACLQSQILALIIWTYWSVYKKGEWFNDFFSFFWFDFIYLKMRWTSMTISMTLMMIDLMCTHTFIFYCVGLFYIQFMSTIIMFGLARTQKLNEKKKKTLKKHIYTDTQ